MKIKKFTYIIIQKFKKFIELFFPGYFSENRRAIKKIINDREISINTIYDIGCFIGGWLEERKKTFPEAKMFYLFDAENLISQKILNDKTRFFHVVLGSDDGKKVNFWKNGRGGSSYFKEIGNTLWDDIEPEILTTVSLNSLIKEKNLELPNYIKIDTQSSEIEILKGLKELINNETLYFIELEMSLYQINEEAPLIGEVIDFMSQNNFVLISVEQLPIVEYFNEKKLAQVNGVFAQRRLISTN